jgi:glycogen debranching enzyme
LQGEREDPATDEEPGKIVHEFRPQAPEWMAEAGWPVRDGELRYYGSADGTSWFLVVLAALRNEALTRELESAWRAAGDWLLRALGRGDGLVRYGPRTEPGGLAQQGWRDSENPGGPDGGGILHADGSVPQPPVADADVQAAAHAGLRALARLSGDAAHDHAADALRARLGELFDPETMAIDGEGRRVRGAGSQLGWLLWARALPDAAAEAAAERLCEPDVLTAFGLRTLSSAHSCFRPDAYHRGSVWPFDSWLGWGGLRALGREREAERVRVGVLDALERLRGPHELYAVTAAGPEPIALSNRVQAWSVGARYALGAGWDGA